MSATDPRLYVVDLRIVGPPLDGVSIGISRCAPFHRLPTVVTLVLAAVLRSVSVVDLLPLSISEVQTSSVAVMDKDRRGRRQHIVRVLAGRSSPAFSLVGEFWLVRGHAWKCPVVRPCCRAATSADDGCGGRAVRIVVLDVGGYANLGVPQQILGHDEIASSCSWSQETGGGSSGREIRLLRSLVRSASSYSAWEPVDAGCVEGLAGPGCGEQREAQGITVILDHAPT
ncbi:hypothetical protein [Streptomyces cavourensis]|uniref:hypothetical protein n=1 Tax=Streptomyces cavourensis TaxID=67258 RepID=UPI001E52AA37|nr:hypothetical protein [Streptomyces cavourensis]